MFNQFTIKKGTVKVPLPAKWEAQKEPARSGLQPTQRSGNSSPERGKMCPHVGNGSSTFAIWVISADINMTIQTTDAGALTCLL